VLGLVKRPSRHDKASTPSSPLATTEWEWRQRRQRWRRWQSATAAECRRRRSRLRTRFVRNVDAVDVANGEALFAFLSSSSLHSRGFEGRGLKNNFLLPNPDIFFFSSLPDGISSSYTSDFFRMEGDSFLSFLSFDLYSPMAK